MKMSPDSVANFAKCFYKLLLSRSIFSAHMSSAVLREKGSNFKFPCFVIKYHYINLKLIASSKSLSFKSYNGRELTSLVIRSELQVVFVQYPSLELLSIVG